MLERVGDLAALMRLNGSRVGVGEVLAAHRAVAAVDPSSRTDVFHALRATLCSGSRDWERFGTIFDAVFIGEPERLAPPPPGFEDLSRVALPRAGIPMAGEAPPADGEQPAPAAWSDEELLRAKDFAGYTDEERAAARVLLARIARRGATRHSRRTIATRRRRGEIHDLRATMRESLRHGGEPFERRFRKPATKPRRLVLVCDVSGSMAAYSRMLLQYVQACVAARARVEAFLFGTHLTRVTRELAGRDPDRALARAAEAVTDWSGGTRIGPSLAQLNREHGRRIGRGSLVVLLSDGWDRGDPEELGAEIARLRRCAHRVVWLNPLAADPRYEPLTRGMQAALAHVDHLLPGNSIASLEALAQLMEEGMR